MGPNDLCYVTRHFLFFPMSPFHFLLYIDVTFYSFYKNPRRTSTTFKVAVSHFVFSPSRALQLPSLSIASYSFTVEWTEAPFSSPIGHSPRRTLLMSQVVSADSNPRSCGWESDTLTIRPSRPDKWSYERIHNTGHTCIHEHLIYCYKNHKLP